MPACFTGGFVQTNGYLVTCPDGTSIVIDAPKGLADWLRRQGILPTALLLTHQHYDHVEDAAELAAMGAKIHAWAPYSTELTLENLMRAHGMPIAVTPYTVDVLLEGSEVLELGGLRLELAHVPGHSTDSVTFFSPERGDLYPGDTLFAGSVGRADLPGGNASQLIDGIRRKLFVLPSSTRVFPGHGPSTRIDTERAENPYCGD
ncbi:MAG: MBL fold metallo-hydrolase [Verrucomicrobia bacterium]|nr:MAG: MBL fold metallo-hydrolase [Verrucomicrobiota bacterium]TAE87655.1 MAG: MBL fold metallo-hydrolase [Verrucomicrobiota bacterium]TAF25410.1 MAG: MBL fold metallo-hydrolase [Verrucomicrobiota bacterium]TAF41197.1 MAG: MBL fold metallo-hydrolase [Verrucomicrobiota bacterium]